MEQFLHHALEQGLHRGTSRRSRWVVVFFFLTGLMWLALFTVSWQRVQGYATEAALYNQAPLCGQAGQTGCRLVAPVTVVQIVERTVGRGERHDFTVRQADNTTVTIEEAVGDLFPYAPEGTIVEANYWQGKIIRLRDAAGHATTSWDDPAWLKSNNTIGLYAFRVAPHLTVIVPDLEHKAVPAKLPNHG